MQTRPVRRPARSLAAVVASSVIALGIIVGPLSTQPAHADGTNKMMLVLDSSGSMKEKLADHKTKIDAARGALDSVIARLPADQQVGLRVYGATVFNHSDKGACTDSQKVVNLGTDNRSQLKAAVKKYKPYGETPTGYALQQAGKDLGSTGRRTIVLVSDGEPTCAPDPCTVAAGLANQGIDLTIDVVGLDVSGKARSMLKCIADKANGHYYDADSADDIDNALDTVATRARRPYQTTGRPVTGSEQSDDAPTITSGDWLDRIGGLGRKRSDLFYTIRRTIPGSTLHIAASLTTEEKVDGLQLKVFGDGTQCGQSSQAHNANAGPIVSVALSAPGFQDWNKDCTDNDTFTVEISRGLNNAFATKSTVPLEIRVSEEPPVADQDALPKELPEPDFSELHAGEVKKIIGGSSFADATAITPGSYSGNLVPGEVQIFSVPVDWGQYLTTETMVKPLSDKVDKAMGSPGPWLDTALYSPSRAQVVNNIKSSTQRMLSKTGADSRAITYPVVYRNRTSFVDSKGSTNRAGNYYVAVSLSATNGESFQLPFTLTVGAVGKVQGKPTYLQHGSKPSASAAPSTSAAPSAPQSVGPTSTASAASRASTPSGSDGGSAAGSGHSIIRAVGISAGVVGGLAVLGGAIALVIVLRRRG